MKVLISDKLSDAGLAIFKNAPGLEIINEPGLGKDVAKLKKVIEDVDAIAIRSGTTLTADILSCAKKLKVIGRAGIGVDNVDIEAASKLGIIVMNTPGGNTVTTAEHAIAMMCALTRSIPQATASMRAGKWEKNKFMGSELYQKVFGIVGCGNIGKIVASRALGLKMNVIAFDPFLTEEIATEIGVKKVDLSELFKTADYISIHTPLNEKTRNLLNKAAFEVMKKGVYIINCARGGIVSESDLAWAIENKIVAGAALDVFEEEPPSPNNPLLKLDAVICTPHLGASTEEAQENVALDVAKQIVDFLVNGTIVNALNTPSLTGELARSLQPMIKMCETLGKLHGQLCKESPKEILINYYGEITKYPTAALTTAILQGILQPMLSDEVSVNSVNAPFLAKERGLKIRESKINSHDSYHSLVEVTLQFKNETRLIAGTLFGKNQPRLIQFNNLQIEVIPEGPMLIVENEDKPGVVGKLGTFLGDNKINIVRLQLGLNEGSKKAIAFYSLQKPIEDKILDGLLKIDGLQSVTQVEL